MTAIITADAFAARRDLCLRAGLNTMTFEQARADSSARRGRADFTRTILHEVGHGGAFLDRSTSYAGLIVRGDGTGHLDPGKRPSGPIPATRHRPLDAAVAAALGGACAEQVLMGQVAPWETVVDMTEAWRRADGDEHLVREQVRRLVHVFDAHRGALRSMGQELRKTGCLTRADCVQLVRAAGWHVDAEPRYLPTRLDALSSKPRADADAETDADAEVVAKSEEAAAAIRSDPAKYRTEWAEFARRKKPGITEAQIEASWQKLCDDYELRAGST